MLLIVCSTLVTKSDGQGGRTHILSVSRCKNNLKMNPLRCWLCHLGCFQGVTTALTQYVLVDTELLRGDLRSEFWEPYLHCQTTSPHTATIRILEGACVEGKRLERGFGKCKAVEVSSISVHKLCHAWRHVIPSQQHFCEHHMMHETLLWCFKTNGCLFPRVKTNHLPASTFPCLFILFCAPAAACGLVILKHSTHKLFEDLQKPWTIHRVIVQRILISLLGWWEKHCHQYNRDSRRNISTFSKSSICSDCCTKPKHDLLISNHSELNMPQETPLTCPEDECEV